MTALIQLAVDERDRDLAGVAIPRPEVHVVARFGPMAGRGLEVHVLGPRQKVHRKTIRAGQRTITARLPLGTSLAVLGVPAFSLLGPPIRIEEVWSDASSRRLLDQLAETRGSSEAAVVLRSVLSARIVTSPSLALAAAERVTHASVSAVANELGVSERNLRRVFREALGVTPKTYAKIARFRRALCAARSHENWASVAATAGYYDQAHLIAEFRAIAGVTPRALLGELRVARDVLGFSA